MISTDTQVRLVKLKTVHAETIVNEWIVDNPILKVGLFVVFTRHCKDIFEIIEVTNILTDLKYALMGENDDDVAWEIGSVIPTRKKLLLSK